jgi:SAM-dependent methyltransferase
MFDVSFLNRLRAAELDTVMPEIAGAKRVLEFGAGTGEQARRLFEAGFDVVAIDLQTSNYTGDRVFPVTDYDGQTIPLDEASVDAVYSSNVLEHIPRLEDVFAEFRRVLKPGGRCIHVLPSVAWRAWTLASGYPAAAVVTGRLVMELIRPPAGTGRLDQALRNVRSIAADVLPLGHGVAKDAFSELWTFSTAAWVSRFKQNGFVVEHVKPVSIFYTGHMLLGPSLELQRRKRLAAILGSANYMYVMRDACDKDNV